MKKIKEKGKLFLEIEVWLINVEVMVAKTIPINCFRQKSSTDAKISRWKMMRNTVFAWP